MFYTSFIVIPGENIYTSPMTWKGTETTNLKQHVLQLTGQVDRGGRERRVNVYRGHSNVPRDLRKRPGHAGHGDTGIRRLRLAKTNTTASTMNDSGCAI